MDLQQIFKEPEGFKIIFSVCSALSLVYHNDVFKVWLRVESCDSWLCFLRTLWLDFRNLLKHVFTYFFEAVMW